MIKKTTKLKNILVIGDVMLNTLFLTQLLKKNKAKLKPKADYGCNFFFNQAHLSALLLNINKATYGIEILVINRLNLSIFQLVTSKTII